MRCFIGCSVSQRDKATLEALIQSRAGAGWRLIPPANYHLTLCFLGDQLPATLALAPFPTPAAPERSAPLRGEGTASVVQRTLCVSEYSDAGGPPV